MCNTQEGLHTYNAITVFSLKDIVPPHRCQPWEAEMVTQGEADITVTKT